MTNLTPPHPPHSSNALGGNPSKRTPNFPSSSNFTTSSAPPTNLPFTNTTGTLT
ncbi:hypothetical protein Fmac_006519 [Flemingia macrophylla]|uniref:Uncharacterized protein n=1 Tax=Flemingia macrophylla TaxID=520843 RepID=A0ABD1NAT7_9FABA